MNSTATLSLIDWLVMGGTILLIVFYGIWRSRGAKDIKSYLLANKEMKWWTIGLSVMATQASAITFLSTPGQAFGDGMRFVQFYLGMPLAIIIICAIFIPLYHKLQVFTAYEYLEKRFDNKTRTLGAFLFLVARSIASGLTISAPALILAVALGWDIYITTVVIGAVVILYTLLGGTKAVAITHKYQMAVIFLGMLIAGILMVLNMPADVSFGDAIFLAGKMGKLNAFTMPESFGDFSNPNDFFNNKYNLLTGLIGGAFLALSYFGTDQSQVQRYLTGRSVSQMRAGLLFNAMVKVPMQFLILFLGALMFVFYIFSYQNSEVLYDQKVRNEIADSGKVEQFEQLNEINEGLNLHLMEKADELLELKAEDLSPEEAYELQYRQEEAMALAAGMNSLTQESIELVEEDPDQVKKSITKNRDYVFLHFVMNMLPIGVIGLLIAVILSAAMSSTAAELNALASVTTVDIYQRLIKREGSDSSYLSASKLFTLAWGLIAIAIAIIALEEENLIQAVNHLGSIFYGPILGIFVAAFFFRKLKGTPVFLGAILAELVILGLEFGHSLIGMPEVPFLWYNVIGVVIVLLVAFLLNGFMGSKSGEEAYPPVSTPELDYSDDASAEDTTTIVSADDMYESDQAEELSPPPAPKPKPKKHIEHVDPFAHLAPREHDSVDEIKKHLQAKVALMAKGLRRITPSRNPETFAKDDKLTALFDFIVERENYTVTFVPRSSDGTHLNSWQPLDEPAGLIPRMRQLTAEDYDLENSSADRTNFENYQLALQQMFLSWFKYCWRQAGGRAAHFPAYMTFEGDTRTYDLKKNKWFDEASRWDA